MKGKSLSHARLFVTPWTAAHQAPLPMGFSRQEHWSGCHRLVCFRCACIPFSKGLLLSCEYILIEVIMCYKSCSVSCFPPNTRFLSPISVAMYIWLTFPNCCWLFTGAHLPYISLIIPFSNDNHLGCLHYSATPQEIPWWASLWTCEGISWEYIVKFFFHKS